MSNPSEFYVLDADSHVIEPPNIWGEYLEKKFHAGLPKIGKDDAGRIYYEVAGTRIMRTASSLSVPFRDETGKIQKRGMPEGGWNPDRRIEDMEEEGIDVAVLYPTLAFFFPELSDSALHAALCRAYNNWLGDFTAAHRDRLIGVALLPLEDVKESVRELERCAEQFGFRGVFARPNPYGGKTLSDRAYDPLWDCAQSLGLPITVHEGISDSLPTLGRERSSNPVIQHLFSHPFEQMGACANLLLEGVADRFPGLRFVFLESGSGWLPYWLNRMDSHWDTWHQKLPDCKRRPSEIFRHQCFIAMDPDDEVAASVAREVGDEVLVWSSDYPHPDAPFPGAVKKTLATLAELSADAQKKILGSNAKRLYGLI